MIKQYAITKNIYIALGCPYLITEGTFVYISKNGLVTVQGNYFIPLDDNSISKAVTIIKNTKLLKLIYE